MTRPAFFLCLALLVAGTVVHGAATQRWTAFASKTDVMAALHGEVVRLGDYQFEEIPSEMPLKEKSTATCRRYFSPSRNTTAMVSVITGPPGAVATHTPDVCYVSSGYKMLRTPVRQTIDLPGGGTAGYYVAEFEKKSATRTERQRVRWAWSADGTWAAPDRPRFAFLRLSELAKVYVVTQCSELDAETTADDPPAVRQFVAATFAQLSGPFAGR